MIADHAMPLSRVLAAALALPLSLALPSQSDAQVIGAHPRIFLSATGHRGITPATLRARCEAGDSPWGRACRSAAPLPMVGSVPLFRNSENPMIALALRYLLFQEPDTLSLLRNTVVQTGMHADLGNDHVQFVTDLPKIRQLAVAYDWLYPALTDPDRALMETYLRSHADWFMAHEPADVFASDAYLQAAGVAFAGLALATDPALPDGGTFPPIESDARRYLSYASTRWRTALLPALAYSRGWWHEGPGIFLREVARPTLQFAAAWTTATDDDMFAYARDRADDVFNLWVRYEAHALRPDFRYAPFGDVTDDDTSSEGFTRPVLDMLAWGTGAPEAQSLALEVSRRARVARDYVGTESWHQLVFYDAARPASPSWQQLPTAMHFSPTAEDVVVMRSGWGNDDTWVSLSCGDWFSGHQHMEVGGLQIYRRAPLVVSTGYYDGFESPHWINWYAQHSVHASTLSVLQPGELFANTRMLPNVNDGGQRPTFSRVGHGTVDQYRANLTSGAQYDTGGITAFEHSDLHDYAACDATRAYGSTVVANGANRPKVREVTRQVVFVRPDFVVVFDRVDATDPSYEKRFTLHALTRPVITDASRFVISQGTARLVGETLLPRGARSALADGYRVDGMTFAPSLDGLESRGSRLDVSPPAGSPARDYFLHVLSTSDAISQTRLPWTLVEDGDRVGARIAAPDANRVFIVTFNRVGPVGGFLRVTDTNGADVYQGGLGAGGRYYSTATTPMLDAGVLDAGTPLDGSTALDGGTTPATPDGCSCHAGTERRTPGAYWVSTFLAAALSARRRRRS